MCSSGSIKSFEDFWEEVGATTGTPWRVEASLDDVAIVSTAKDGLGVENLRRLLLRFPWNGWMVRHFRITTLD